MLAGTTTVLIDTPLWPSVASLILTAALVGITFWYAYQTRKQVTLLEAQGTQIDELEKQRARRAVRAILSDLGINTFIARCGEMAPFLSDAYPAGLTVLADAPAQPDSLAQIAAAPAGR